MHRIAAIAFAAGILLSGCTTFRSMVGDPVADDALVAVKGVITGYADVYQPAVIVYGRLPSCGKPTSPAICRDDDTFHQLQDLDRKATDAIAKAHDALAGKAGDTGQIAAASNAVAQATAAIAVSGALTAPAQN